MESLNSGNSDEHAPRGHGSIPEPMGYEPSEEDKKTIKLVYQIFEKNKEYRRKYDHRWNDYYLMFRGKQWKEQRPSYRHSEVINMIFQTIQSFIPILTDAKPKIEFLPEEPSDIPFAHVLNSVMSSDWDKGKWLMKVTESLYDAHFYGLGFGTVEYDPKALGGLGMNVHKSIDPFHCFPDPDATDTNENADNFVHAEPISISKLKAQYPEHKDHIKPDLLDMTKEKRTELYNAKFRSPTDAAGFVETDNQDGRAGGSQDKALKITCYIKSSDYEEKALKEIDPQTGMETEVFEQKLKYPKGRRVCIASGVLLEEGEIVNDEGKFPYPRLVNYILPREYWGISEIEQLESPQKIFNKLVSFTLDVLVLMGNPIWILDEDSNVEEENLVNKPGLIVTKARGSDVRRVEGVQLQPYVLSLIDRMKVWFDDISGANDVTRGVEPAGGITAASAIQSLQQAAQTRIRLKSRYLDAYLMELGELWLDLALKVYTSPRVFRITNNPDSYNYFKFHVEQSLDDQGQPMLNEAGSPMRRAYMTPFNQDPASGQMVMGERKEFQVSGRFDVKVSTGSSLPFAKQEKFAMAKEMFRDGVIDRQEYLKASDWPNWEALEQRMVQKEQQKAQAEVQSQGQTMPGVGQGMPLG